MSTDTSGHAGRVGSAMGANSSTFEDSLVAIIFRMEKLMIAKAVMNAESRETLQKIHSNWACQGLQ
jgi:hypothetical protein